jgi:hypothetical protein
MCVTIIDLYASSNRYVRTGGIQGETLTVFVVEIEDEFMGGQHGVERDMRTTSGESSLDHRST